MILVGFVSLTDDISHAFAYNELGYGIDDHGRVDDDQTTGHYIFLSCIRREISFLAVPPIRYLWAGHQIFSASHSRGLRFSLRDGILHTNLCTRAHVQKSHNTTSTMVMYSAKVGFNLRPHKASIRWCISL